jgi:hypothetical protein
MHAGLFGEVYFQAAIQFPGTNEVTDVCVLPGEEPRALTMHENYFIPVLKVWKEQADLAAQEGRR